MRIPVSAPQNAWFDSQNVDDDDLDLEQNFNNQIQAGIINNHFGSGVLPDNLIQPVLFDSSLANGLLDGKPINVQFQPSDSNSGNQLEIELTGSKAAGKRAVKLVVIGLDFQNNIQYDQFTFNKNEKQVSAKHYKTILTILFNDFVGTQAQSFNLGGRLTIKEAGPFVLSRDCIMISQDVEPNIFFRDFYVSSGGTLNNVLTNALPSYNIDSLKIMTGYRQLRGLLPGDVSSQVGQKFLASGNNIQKITLLMSVDNAAVQWSGDLLISISQLQSSVNCPTDIIPQLAIDFDPSNIPIAQLSITYSSLLNSGIVLSTVPQPVDFIFSNTPLGSGLVLTAGNYYVVMVKRAGDSSAVTLQFATGDNSSTVQRESLFHGSVWVDVPEESLWFQVWSDSAKVSSGSAYDNGHGIDIPKTNIDPTTGATIDYVLNDVQFSRNDLFSALVQANTVESVPVEDDRTGNPILTQKQYAPSVSLLNAAALANIQNISEPLFIGTITDSNVKSYNGATATLNASLSFHEYGLTGNQITIKIITDSTDGYRYNTNIIELVSELINGNLNSAKIIPNISNPDGYYRIAKAELVSLMYGDINGDGVIDTSDLLLAQNLLNLNLNIIPSYSKYLTSTTSFENNTGLSWTVVNPIDFSVIASGSDGIITTNPNIDSQAGFHSTSATFNSIITNIGNYTLNIVDIINEGNNGVFVIASLIGHNDLTIRKIVYNSTTILQAMAADIDCDMNITVNDVNYITNYINLVSPFPATTSPANRIGTNFNALVLTVEEFVDRVDDYPGSDLTRNTDIHPVPDVYLDGYSLFAGLNLKTSPLMFTITKQLVWQESSVVVNSNPRLVPAAFNYGSGYVNNINTIGNTSESFPLVPGFDPGRNDLFIANNLVINDGGQLVNKDNSFYKVDYEIGTVLFEIPAINFPTEKTFNILTDFVANFNGSGYTRIGYQSMKFADNSYVSLDALINNQIRVEVGLVSYSPLLQGIDGYGIDGYECLSGVIVDNKIGVSLDQSTLLLTLNFDNLIQDIALQTLNTKISITCHLKKAGWLNNQIYITSNKTQNLLGIPTPTPSPIDCPPPSIIIVS